MNVSGTIELRKGKRGSVWHAKYRLANGSQRMKKIGPAWNERGRPPGGYFTRKTAKGELDAILTDARRGTGEPGGTGATFADAASEFLRYVADVRKIDAGTARDYRGCH